MTIARLSALALGAVLASHGAHAGDVGIDGNLPLRVEDAEPTDAGALQLQLSTRYERREHGANAVTIEPRLKWGVVDDLDIQIQTPILTGDGDHAGSRNVQLRSQWRFFRERGLAPDLAVQVELDAPSGVRSAGLDTQLEGIATKTLTTAASRDQIHLAAAWIHDAAARPGERDDRYFVVGGYTRRLVPTALLVADVVREQESDVGRYANLIEVGIVAMAGERVTLGAGIGAGVGQASPDFVANLALQVAIVEP